MDHSFRYWIILGIQSHIDRELIQGTSYYKVLITSPRPTIHQLDTGTSIEVSIKNLALDCQVNLKPKTPICLDKKNLNIPLPWWLVKNIINEKERETIFHSQQPPDTHTHSLSLCTWPQNITTSLSPSYNTSLSKAKFCFMSKREQRVRDMILDHINA